MQCSDKLRNVPALAARALLRAGRCGGSGGGGEPSSPTRLPVHPLHTLNKLLEIYADQVSGQPAAHPAPTPTASTPSPHAYRPLHPIPTS